jgi:hypothetical protein
MGVPDCLLKVVIPRLCPQVRNVTVLSRARAPQVEQALDKLKALLGVGLWRSRSNTVLSAPAPRFASTVTALQKVQDSTKVNSERLEGEMKSIWDRRRNL